MGFGGGWVVVVLFMCFWEGARNPRLTNPLIDELFHREYPFWRGFITFGGERPLSIEPVY